MTTRDELTAHVRTILATPKATDAWRTDQIVDWLWDHRVVLCAHEAPPWDCQACPAFQAAMARAQGAERRLASDTPYQHGYDDGYLAAQMEETA